MLAKAPIEWGLPYKRPIFLPSKAKDHGPYTKIYKTHCKVLAKDKPLNLSLHSCRTRLHHQLSLNQQNGKKDEKKHTVIDFKIEGRQCQP